MLWCQLSVASVVPVVSVVSVVSAAGCVGPKRMMSQPMGQGWLFGEVYYRLSGRF